jgi:predicted AlkP superfamily phosphohydrolase/phosphomutase
MPPVPAFRSRAAVVGLGIALALGGVAACRSGEPDGATPAAVTPRGRILIFGIDAATPRVVEAWMEEGLLPNLQGLAREGAWGPLASHHPLLSPRIWTSIATGKAPKRHGIEYWVHRTGPRKRRLYRSTDRKGPAIWNILSDRGLRVGVVNWLITYPPEKVEGVLVSDFAIPGERRKWENMAIVHGRKKAPPQGPIDQAITTWPASWADDPFVTSLIESPRFTDEVAVHIALAVEEEENSDLLMVYLPGIDRISHFIWAGVEPGEAYPEEVRPTDAQRAKWREVLRRYYAYTDALLGVLLARYGRDDLVLVVSDHGFEARSEEPGRTGNHLTAAAEMGVIFARGPGVPAASRIEGMSVNDVTPTVLAWLGLPVAQDMDGRPAAFVEVEATEEIASYDRGPIERVETTSDELEKDVIEQLRALGYVD